jgi:steroid delta-isomerase-like uncharacterized protein
VTDEAFVRGFAATWVDAWNRHDADALLALCTPDTVWNDPAAAGELHGPADVRSYLREVWTTFPDLSFELVGAPFLAADGRAAQLWRLRGTMLGPNPDNFAPTGRSMDLLGLDLYEFRDGLLANYRTLYDMMETARQLELIPPPGSRGARVAAFMQRTSVRLKRRR